MKLWRCSSCKPSLAYDVKQAPAIPNPELPVMHNDLSVLSTDVISITWICKSLQDVVRLDIDAVFLAVTAPNTAQDINFKLLHSLFNPDTKGDPLFSRPTSQFCD